MGRMNNKRTQAAAQAAKHTPSRARFSKGPPNKNKGRGGRGGRGADKKEKEPPPKPKSRGIGSGGGGSGGRGSGGRNGSGGRGGRGRGNAQTTARVIDKIGKRNDAKKPSASATAISGNSNTDMLLKNLDMSKIDVVAVSKETQNLISDLLRELGVVGNSVGTTGSPNNNRAIDNSSTNVNDNVNVSNSNGNDRSNGNGNVNVNVNANHYQESDATTPITGSGQHREDLESFMDNNNADDMVWVIQKEDQQSGRETTGGRIQKILTNSDYHPRGIKVLLEDGIVGRVSRIGKRVRDNTINDEIRNNNHQHRQLMNPNASEYNPPKGDQMEEDSDDDSSVDSYQRMYDFLTEQSDARNTDTAIVEDVADYDYNYMDEDDEMQKRMAADRRRKDREEEPKEDREKDKEETDENENDPIVVVSENEAEGEENFENDRTFLHLTKTLSFSHSQASKACRAIECWDTNMKPQDDAVDDTNNKNDSETTDDPRDSKLMSSINDADDDNKLELAMDWLCLHLSDAEINRGFRPNTSASKASSVKALRDKNSKAPIVIGKIKAIAHPSISVISKPIEEQAKEWAKTIELQERALKLMRLGFHRADAIQAFDDLSTSDGDAVDVDVAASAVIDDPALPLLLSKLQDGTEVSDANFDNTTLLEDAREEREQELEALSAIYDDRLEVVYRTTNGNPNHEIPDRYVVQIYPATPLGEPAKADEIFLHVFLRDKYPLAQTPLLLLRTKPALPPSLCRKILSKLGETAQDVLGAISDGEMGCPVVFEAVAYLEDNLPIIHKEFCNEQRRKEFEAEQARLLKQRQIEMEKADMELMYGKSGGSAKGGVESSLGRRQKAKLKAAEKVFDRPEQTKELYKEFRTKQEKRIKVAQHQSQPANIRATKAQQAILKRQKELIDGEAEDAARSAMSKAFRNGKSKEEARAAAVKARIESYRENGVMIANKDEKENKEKTENKGDKPAKGVPKAPVQVPKPTEASSKFMERLQRTDGEAVTVTIDSSPEAATEAKKKPTKGPTPNTSAFMDRLRGMYENAAKNGKNPKGEKEKGNDSGKGGKGSMSSNIDGYHLDSPEDKNEEVETNDENHAELSSSKRPNPVAVPAGELKELMNDIITQQEAQPWLVSAEARAPTTTHSARKVSPAKLKREKEISDRLKSELSRKRRMAKEWAKTNSGNGAENKANKNNSKNNGGKRRKKQDTSFTPERFQGLLEVRQRLPAFQLKEELVQTIDRNQITVIAGATGCGKTTQVPQLVLDDLIMRGFGAATNMIVTQPRRISAIGVSERISQERCEKVGETCGYSIKLEKKMSARTRLLLCTTGVLLRRLQCDPDLASISHIFVDEVHERDLNTDFLIIILKDLLARRKDLKLVLMSATLNADSFSSYFGGCPVVSIPGRAHPVEENRLEDILELTGYKVEEGGDYALKTGRNKTPAKVSKSTLRRLYSPKYSKETIHSLSIVDETAINYELLSELLEHISLNQGEGAILVFCPGFQEIQKTIEEMYKKEHFQGSGVVIYPLHSSLSTEEQVAIFEIPPPGIRKIVVSTNIAETSITIEDVVFVVDTGRVKENRRDEVNETPTLEECWVSRASAKQRRGRAGRVRPGVAYHMYSSHTHDDEMLEYQLPEMLRVGIEDLVLQILILDLGEPTSFLKKALDPPSNLALANSLRLLEELGAVDCQWKNQRSRIFSSSKEKQKEEEDLDVSSELTALGFHLATLPVDPRVGKMMIYGALFGCIDPLLTFAAAMSSRSPFVSPFDKREQADEARKTFSVAGSDHLTILNAFNQWSELRQTEGNHAVNSFLKENFLGRLTLFQMEDLRKQFHSLLINIGFLPKKFRLKDLNHASNNNSQNQGLVKAVLCAGLYPNIIVAPRTVVGTAPSKKSDKKVGDNAFRSHTKGEVYLHPSTIAFNESKLDSRYCCYHELVRTSKTYVRDCTTVSPFALLLFGGTLEVYQTHGICSVDGWLKFRIDAKPATLIKYLRGKMERLLFQKIVSPHEDVIESDEGRALIQSISRLFETEHNLQKTMKQEEEVISNRSGAEIIRPWTGTEGENNRINAIQNETRNNNNRNRHDDIEREGRGGRGRGGRRSGRSGRGRTSRR